MSCEKGPTIFGIVKVFSDGLVVTVALTILLLSEGFLSFFVV